MRNMTKTQVMLVPCACGQGRSGLHYSMLGWLGQPGPDEAPDFHFWSLDTVQVTLKSQS